MILVRDQKRVSAARYSVEDHLIGWWVERRSHFVSGRQSLGRPRWTRRRFFTSFLGVRHPSRASGPRRTKRPNGVKKHLLWTASWFDSQFRPKLYSPHHSHQYQRPKLNKGSPLIELIILSMGHAGASRKSPKDPPWEMLNQKSNSPFSVNLWCQAGYKTGTRRYFG